MFSMERLEERDETTSLYDKNEARARFISAITAFSLDYQGVIEYLSAGSDEILEIGDPEVLLRMLEHFDYIHNTPEFRALLSPDGNEDAIIATFDALYEENLYTNYTGDKKVKLLDKISSLRTAAILLKTFIGYARAIEFMRKIMVRAVALEFLYSIGYVPPQLDPILTDEDIERLSRAQMDLKASKPAFIRINTSLEEIFEKFQDPRDLADIVVNSNDIIFCITS